MAIEIKGSIGGHPTLISESAKQTKVQAPNGQQHNVQNINSPASAGGSDTVNLTGTAAQLRSLEHSLAQQPVVDNQRVSSVRNDINAGTFSVNAERVAEKMIQMETMISSKLG